MSDQPPSVARNTISTENCANVQNQSLSKLAKMKREDMTQHSERVFQTFLDQLLLTQKK